MKILFLANPLLGSTGGDRRSFEVLQRLSGRGVEAVVAVDDFVMQKMKAEDNPLLDRLKVYSIKRPNVIYNRYFRSVTRAWLDYYSISKTAGAIADIARKENVELIISHHEKTDFLLEAYSAAKKLSLPWTCVFQLPLFPPYASTVWRPVGRGRRLYMHMLYSWLYKKIAEAMKSTDTLAVSPSIELETKSYLGGLNFTMHVLQPGVGVDNEELRKIPASEERVDAFFFSRLAPEKGIYDLPEIASELAKVKSDSRFLFGGRFGASSFKTNLDSMVAKKQLGEHLSYKGFLEQRELYGLVKAAKVLVYPSRHDAFPLVVLETLACGTPVVAYGIPAVKSNFPADIVRAVPVGDFTQMAAEALRIIQNPNLRGELSQKGKAFTAKYSWENVAAAEVNAYGRVLAKFKKPSASA